GGLDAFLGAVGQDQGDDGPHGGADEEADHGDDQRRRGRAVVLRSRRVAIPVAGRRPVGRLPVAGRRRGGRLAVTGGRLPIAGLTVARGGGLGGRRPGRGGWLGGRRAAAQGLGGAVAAGLVLPIAASGRAGEGGVELMLPMDG